MSLRRLYQSWNEFFFTPQSPLPVCVFRILYGLIALANLIMLRPEWLKWYGPHAMMSIDTMHKLGRGPNMSVFELIPQTDLAVNIFFWVFLVCTVFLTIGYLTRFSAVAVYICLGSIQMRNGYILNSGDTLMIVTGFFLMFAPAGAALSVDRWLRLRRGHESVAVALYSPWAQRMIQIQLAVVYFATFYWKTLGVLWMNGTAVYYALRLEDFHRFPMPHLQNMFVIKSLTWLTLVIEFALGVLIWFKETRYPVLLAGLCLHLGIEYAMNIPLFEWMAVATYVTFIYPEDLSRSLRWFNGQFAKVLDKFARFRTVGQQREIIPTVALVRDGHV